MVEARPTNNLPDTNPGTNGRPGQAQIAIGGLQAATVVDRHSDHPGDSAGEGHHSPGRRPHFSARSYPEVDAPMPGVFADRGELSDDWGGNGRSQAGAARRGNQRRSGNQYGDG